MKWEKWLAFLSRSICVFFSQESAENLPSDFLSTVIVSNVIPQLEGTFFAFQSEKNSDFWDCIYSTWSQLGRGAGIVHHSSWVSPAGKTSAAMSNGASLWDWNILTFFTGNEHFLDDRRDKWSDKKIQLFQMEMKLQGNLLNYFIFYKHILLTLLPCKF